MIVCWYFSRYTALSTLDRSSQRSSCWQSGRSKSSSKTHRYCSHGQCCFSACMQVYTPTPPHPPHCLEDETEIDMRLTWQVRFIRPQQRISSMHWRKELNVKAIVLPSELVQISQPVQSMQMESFVCSDCGCLPTSLFCRRSMSPLSRTHRGNKAFSPC